MNGYKSSLLFKIGEENCENNKEIIFSFQKYFDELSDTIILKVLLNENLFENLEITKSLDYKINLSEICKKNKELKIDFIVNNPKSLFDFKIGLNRKKRSIILSEIKIIK